MQQKLCWYHLLPGDILHRGFNGGQRATFSSSQKLFTETKHNQLRTFRVDSSTAHQPFPQAVSRSPWRLWNIRLFGWALSCLALTCTVIGQKCTKYLVTILVPSCHNIVPESHFWHCLTIQLCVCAFVSSEWSDRGREDEESVVRYFALRLMLFPFIADSTLVGLSRWGKPRP